MNNEELELSFLGDLMLSNDIQGLLADVASQMKADDFNNQEAKQTFSVINDIANNGDKVSPISISQAGVDVGFVSSVAQRGLSANNAIQKAKMIHSLAKKRNLYLKAQQVMQNLASGDDVETVKSDLSTFLNGDVDVSSNTTKKIDEVLNPTLDSILSVKENGGIAGITTGFKTIDKYIGGLLRGSLTIIGARPAMGKTAFALNMAEESAKRTNKPVLIISLEMNNEMLVKRMFAKESNISSEKIRDGNLDENEIGRLTFASDKMSKLPIWFDDTPIQSFDDIRSRVLRLQRQQGELGMVMIDYLGLIETGNERNSNRVNEVSKISRGLKVLSKEVDAPIVALAQLNRGVEQRTDKRPLLSDLRDSGSIEQDADNVAFLYRDDYYRNEGEEQPNDDEISTVEFIIAKNRNGKRGTIQLAFNKKYSMMTDWVNEPQGSTVW